MRVRVRGACVRREGPGRAGATTCDRGAPAWALSDDDALLQVVWSLEFRSNDARPCKCFASWEGRTAPSERCGPNANESDPLYRQTMRSSFELVHEGHFSWIPHHRGLRARWSYRPRARQPRWRSHQAYTPSRHTCRTPPAARNTFCGSGKLTGFGAVKTRLALRPYAAPPAAGCVGAVGTRTLTFASGRKNTLRLAVKGVRLRIAKLGELQGFLREAESSRAPREVALSSAASPRRATSTFITPTSSRSPASRQAGARADDSMSRPLRRHSRTLPQAIVAASWAGLTRARSGRRGG